MHAIVIEQHGGPEVLTLKTRDLREVGTGEVRVRIEASGVNFIDVYQRTGHYKVPLPFTPGLEGAGVIEALGQGVSDFKVGQRVAWGGVAGTGGYAAEGIFPAERLVAVPDGLDAKQASAAMLQGMTAHFLVESTYPVKKGDIVLVHAGAGGVGLLLTQLAKERGATVFTTVSTEEKAELSRGAGADHVILYTQQDFVSEVKRLTSGAGVHAVFDSVGKTTFEKGLEVLRPRGMMVLFGGASGPVAPLDPLVLNTKGSLFLTRPTLFHYIADRASLLHHANAVLERVRSGALKLRIECTWSLAEAASAHEALEARKTTGKVLLIP